MKRTNPDAVKSAIELLESGDSVRQVAKKLRLARSTVGDIRKKHLPDLPQPKGGRPQSLSENDCRYATRLITTGTFDTAIDVSRHFKKTSGITVSPDTIRRTLKKRGLKAGTKVRKPLLTLRHRKLRLKWAKMYKDMESEDWRKVIFSDETKINLFGSDGKKWCWKKRGKSLEKRLITQTVKHGGGKIIVWGCMTAAGVGFATRIIGNMDSELYQSILGGELKETINWYKMKKSEVTFQHDNDPKHTAKSTQEFLRKHRIRTLRWPPQSPDMNPIEHLWRYVKIKLALNLSQPKNADDMWTKFEQVWNAIPTNFCEKLIDSMPKRVKALIKARGGHTKY